MSKTISAFGLSFWATSRSMISTTGARATDDQRVAGLVRLDHRDDRHPGHAHHRADQLAQLGGVGMRQIERLDDLIVVLRVLLRVVLEDQDRPLAQHLVGEAVVGQQLAQRLLDGHAAQVGARRLVAHGVQRVAVVDDADAALIGEKRQDVAQVGVRRESQIDDVGHGFRTGGCAAARACARSASIGDGGRAASLRARICCSRLVTLAAAVWLLGSYSAASRYSLRAASSWSCCFELLRAIEVLARRGDHGALERDLVRRVVGILLDRDAVVGHGLVGLAHAHGVVALAVGAAGSAPAGGDRHARGSGRLV